MFRLSKVAFGNSNLVAQDYPATDSDRQSIWSTT